MILPEFSRRAAGLALFALVACDNADTPDAYGNVEATDVMVAAQVSGVLTSFVPQEGTTLPAGGVVAVVDTGALVLQLAQVRAQRTTLTARQAEVNRQIDVWETQRQVAERTWQRQQRLYAQQSTTAAQVDQAERELRTLEKQIEAARAQWQTVGRDAQATDTRAASVQDLIRRSVVVNPAAGTVLTTYAAAGEFVQAGQPLYKIAALDTVDVRAWISETQLALVKIGARVDVTNDVGAQRRTIPGTVTWISAQAEFTPTPIQTRDERANLVYAIKVRVPNPDGSLKLGMPVDVRLPGGATS
jgi:HlyD family secretion protein